MLNIGKFENRVFEDLPEADQDKMMENRDPEWIKSLAKRMATSLRFVSDKVDITCENDDES